MKNRNLKVSSKMRRLGSNAHLHTYDLVPEIRLCGKWLAAAGFEAGTQVCIEIEDNQLIIKKRA